MGRLVHTVLGSSSLVAHVLHLPPPHTREQLCNRYCSNKQTRALLSPFSSLAALLSLFSRLAVLFIKKREASKSLCLGFGNSCARTSTLYFLAEFLPRSSSLTHSLKYELVDVEKAVWSNTKIPQNKQTCKLSTKHHRITVNRQGGKVSQCQGVRTCCQWKNSKRQDSHF